MSQSAVPVTRPAGKPFRAALWIAQAALAAVYIPAGLTKLATPIAKLSTMMPWAGDVAPLFVRFIGVTDLAAGLGVLLPALTRIAPRLTVWAAIGATVLQAFAMVFHASRGEWMILPMNAVLFALAVFVAFGRGRYAPIKPRRAD